MNYLVVFVTCSSKREANKLARSLLKKRLIACANILGRVESHFWWNKEINSAKEYLLLLKTKRRFFKKVERELRRLHSYEVPEIIALPIVAGSKRYLEWIEDSL